MSYSLITTPAGAYMVQVSSIMMNLGNDPQEAVKLLEGHIDRYIALRQSRGVDNSWLVAQLQLAAVELAAMVRLELAREAGAGFYKLTYGSTWGGWLLYIGEPGDLRSWRHIPLGSYRTAVDSVRAQDLGPLQELEPLILEELEASIALDRIRWDLEEAGGS